VRLAAAICDRDRWRTDFRPGDEHLSAAPSVCLDRGGSRCTPATRDPLRRASLSSECNQAVVDLARETGAAITTEKREGNPESASPTRNPYRSITSEEALLELMFRNRRFSAIGNTGLGTPSSRRYWSFSTEETQPGQLSTTLKFWALKHPISIVAYSVHHTGAALSRCCGDELNWPVRYPVPGSASDMLSDGTRDENAEQFRRVCVRRSGFFQATPSIISLCGGYFVSPAMSCSPVHRLVLGLFGCYS